MCSHRHVILRQHLSNFVIIRRSAAELCRHIDFQDGGHIELEVYFRFGFHDGTCLRRWICVCICILNFDEISQCTAEMKLLPVSKNGRPPFWNSICGFDFDVYVVIGMSFCICLPNFVVIRRWWAEL